MRWRIILYSLLIGLPAMGFVGAGVYLGVVEVPRMMQAEPRRITFLYRDIAEGLLERPQNAAYVGARKKGWRQVGKIDGKAWGREARGNRVEVWVQAFNELGQREWRSTTVEKIGKFPFGWAFYGCGTLAALFVLGLAGLAIACFVRFMKGRDDFLAATAHDLMTPLAGLRMTIGRNDEEAKLLNERMIRLVENIRDFLKMGGRRVPRTADFDLRNAYREAYALFADDYRDLFDGADVSVQGAENPVLVHADETMAVQILWNLLGNDLKYAAPHGRVAVRFSTEGAWVRVAFADEGPGMTKREMRKAFDRYYRAKKVLQSGRGGFGIGLCAAREFARAMGGDLTVAANASKGCTFTLSLPAAI